MYCTNSIPSVLICICTINKDYYYNDHSNNDFTTSGRPGMLNTLRRGFLADDVLCRSGVRAKAGINMVIQGEP